MCTRNRTCLWCENEKKGGSGFELLKTILRAFFVIWNLLVILPVLVEMMHLGTEKGEGRRPFPLFGGRQELIYEISGVDASKALFQFS